MAGRMMAGHLPGWSRRMLPHTRPMPGCWRCPMVWRRNGSSISVPGFPACVILDLSADYRFDPGWTYGLPERFRDQIRTSKLIANPGCYATGSQLGLLPLKDRLASPPVIFGVSGFSGAGKTPSPRNDPEMLRDNLMPYALSGHVHEQEISLPAGQGRQVSCHTWRHFSVAFP